MTVYDTHGNFDVRIAASSAAQILGVVALAAMLGTVLGLLLS